VPLGNAVLDAPHPDTDCNVVKNTFPSGTWEREKNTFPSGTWEREKKLRLLRYKV